MCLNATMLTWHELWGWMLLVHKNDMEYVMRLHLTVERKITACSSGQLRSSEHWIGMLDSIWCNGRDCRLAWLWQLLVLSQNALYELKLSSQFDLYTLLGLKVGGNQISSEYNYSRTWGRSLAVTDPATEARLTFRFRISLSTLARNLLIIDFKI